jgi:hypothetical protein
MVQNAMETANIAIVYASSWEQETKYVVRVYCEVQGSDSLSRPSQCMFVSKAGSSTLLRGLFYYLS